MLVVAGLGSLTGAQRGGVCNIEYVVMYLSIIVHKIKRTAPRGLE